MATRFRRCKRGATLAELPVALYIFLIVLLFPLIDLATIGLRAATAYLAAYNAAHSAAKAATFQGPAIPPVNGQPQTFAAGSAVQTARDAASATKSSLLTGTDFSDQDVTVRIVGLPLNTPPAAGETPTPPKIQFIGADNAKLTGGIDPGLVYLIEVSINARIQPLLMLSQDLIGPIPGLTVPIPFTVTTRQMCENTDGLNQ